MRNYADIKSLVSIIAAKREPLNHHGSRTAIHAMKLAMVLQLSSEMVQLIETGAHLHDIGKLLIPLHILNAERKLTEEERAEMETHAQLGWEIVHDAGYDQVILNIVRHHHEQWNGGGYPDKLSGRSIPIEAQVVAIADTYDALTSNRPYREPFSHPFAMALIQKGKRTVFDSELVDLFFKKVALG